MESKLLGPVAILLLGCGGSGPVALAGAKIVDVRVYAHADQMDGGSKKQVDLSKAEQIPCFASEVKLAVEVRAIPKGGTKPEVFVTGGGLAERAKASPGDYKEFEIADAASYESSHTFDMREIDFEVNEAVAVDRVGEAAQASGMDGSSSMEKLDVETVTFKLDPKKGVWSGYEITIVPKFAADKKVKKSWKPDLTCVTKTVESGASGDLKHPRGDAGPRITVYVTKAKTPFGEAMLALIDSAKGSRYVLADLGSPHTFVAGGGNGVEGTSVQPGGDGGEGGTIQILFDERFMDLEKQLKFEAPGGKGGRGSPDGKEGPPGQGAIKKSDEAIAVLAKRKDLPKGVELIDPPKDKKPVKPTPKK